MKTKIINESFDKDTGLTIVTIQNKYGHFTGTAKCHPDEIDNFSMFQGERIAATRANINFLKFRIKQEKAKIKAVRAFSNDLYSLYLNDIIYDKKVNHIWEHAIIMEDTYEKNIENFKTSIEILNNSIKLMDKDRQDILLRSNKNK